MPVATATKAKRQPLHPAEQYARDIVACRILSSAWVRLACQRHINDLREAHRRGLRFDPAAGQDALDFFRLLRHSKGEWAGQSFTLEPWQQFIIWSVYGWKRADGTRRFRTARVELGKKNGKTTLCAGNGLLLAFFDGEPGAEVYCVATKMEQAELVHDEAVRMRDASPALKKHIQKFKRNLSLAATNSKFEPLGADESTLDGPNIHALIKDEVHAWKRRALMDVLMQGMAARRQPLGWDITTAGYDRDSVCFTDREYACKVLQGIIDDDSVFAYIACLDMKADGLVEHDDDWEDEANWIKANPNLGVSVKLDQLREQAHKAKNDPASLNAFLRLRLNVWTQQDIRWMPMDKWNACAGWNITSANPGHPRANDPVALRATVLEMLKGRSCCAGLDLSTTIDLAAFCPVFAPTEDLPLWVVVPYFWVPEDNIEKRVKRDRVPYDAWIRQGFITATPGNVQDYDFIRAEILKFRDVYDLKEIAFDRWNATQLSTQLDSDGITMVEFGQGFASMNKPTKRLMELVLSKKLAHLGNPVLRWNADNLVVRQDPAGNLKPDKDKSSEKIDGAVAMIMGQERAQANELEGGSAYDHHGILTL